MSLHSHINNATNISKEMINADGVSSKSLEQTNLHIESPNPGKDSQTHIDSHIRLMDAMTMRIIICVLLGELLLSTICGLVVFSCGGGINILSVDTTVVGELLIAGIAYYVGQKEKIR